MRGVAELELLVRPAVEETVETIDGGGDGVSEREGGAGGDGDPNIVVNVVFVFLEGLVNVEFAVPGVEQITPLAFIVSLCSCLATITVLHTASNRKNSCIQVCMGLNLVMASFPSISSCMSRAFTCSASLGLTGMMALSLFFWLNEL